MTEVTPEVVVEPLPLVAVLDLGLEWELDADEIRLATGCLEDLSDDARYYGSNAWLTPDLAPRQVRSLVRRAVARFLRNPDGYTTSRAGDETVGWTDRGSDMGHLTFSDREIKMLRQHGGKAGLVSVDTYAYTSRIGRIEDEGFVTVEGGGDLFPYFNTDTEPW